MRSLLVFLSLCLGAAWAQSTGTATLVGTVTDTTGAVITAARVTVVNTETSFVSNGRTNHEG